jgi:hypothetical protein
MLIHICTDIRRNAYTYKHTHECIHLQRSRSNVLGAQNSKSAYRKAHLPLHALLWMGGTYSDITSLCLRPSPFFSTTHCQYAVKPTVFELM